MTLLIIVSLSVALLVGYARWLTHQVNLDNYKVTPDHEREQWNQLWDQIAPLPSERRARIRHFVLALRATSGPTTTVLCSGPRPSLIPTTTPTSSLVSGGNGGSVN